MVSLYNIIIAFLLPTFVPIFNYKKVYISSIPTAYAIVINVDEVVFYGSSDKSIKIGPKLEIPTSPKFDWNPKHKTRFFKHGMKQSENCAENGMKQK